MKTYNLRSVLRRGSMLTAAFVIAGASLLSAAPTFADELNPLTDRSLSLSSSSPGWDYKDGSGNSTYAVPNSGANGKQTGNTFAFKVSTDTTASGSEVKSMTFQYCTKSAGLCYGPGNNTFTSSARATNAASEAAQKSDLEIVASSPSEVGTFGSYISSSTGEVTAIPAATSTGNNFVVYYNDGGTWTKSAGWNMAVSKVQNGTIAAGNNTDKNNFITLTNSTGQGFEAGQEVKIVFFATDTNYITNPGEGEFFVKINTYNSDTTRDATTLVDGGVTVANVMNQSIQITTKVLETMQFSVGTVDPYTLADGAGSAYEDATGDANYGTCDPIVRGLDYTQPSNTLQLGDQDAESSLNVDATYSTHSYWRLSSNSSAGATVYYAGVTLSNTVGDKIDAIGGTATAPHKGTEQFGLAIAAGAGTNNTNSDGTKYSSDGSYAVDYGVERSAGMYYENGADNTTSGITAGALALAGVTGWHAPRLSPLIPKDDYDKGAGYINSDYATANSGTVTTEFAFDDTSNTIPVAIASEDAQVVDCVSAKMRYIANIAATTPAGIYTTKINYIASPQY